jgi:hypothetical protein
MISAANIAAPQAVAANIGLFGASGKAAQALVS